jgi:uncharacterized protein YkwD
MESMVLNLMRAVLVAAVLFILPLVNQGFSSPVVHQPKLVAAPPGVKHLQEVEDLVFEITNRARQAKGLAPLIKDSELTIVARAYSDDMLLRRFFDHTNPDGLSFHKRISNHYGHLVSFVGENIYSALEDKPINIREVAEEIMDTWINSKDHRENLLDPDYTHLGVGVSASQGKIRVTQEFVGRSKALGPKG